MQLRPDQLEQALRKQAPLIWLIAGDEPFQRTECADQVRRWAREAQGFTERRIFSSDSGIDWDAFYNESRAMSLFGDRRILEVRLGEKRPDRKASEILVEICTEPPTDTLLLITASRLDRRRDMKSKWVQAVDRAGALVQVWPVAPERMAGWAQQRLRQKGVRASSDAVALLAERSEGNLLACAQEIDKLALLHGEEEISAEQVQQAVGQSSRYSPFDLTDALGRGGAERTLRILDTLLAEGVEPPVILWALARELRAMAAMAEGMDPGIPMPPKRLQALRARASQLGLPALQRGQALAARTDQAIKGAVPDDPRQLLAALLLRLCDHPLPEPMEASA